jgi:hypothetical protein
MRKIARKSDRKTKVMPKILEDLVMLREALPVFEESKVKTICLGARKVTIEVGIR